MTSLGFPLSHPRPYLSVNLSDKPATNTLGFLSPGLHKYYLYGFFVGEEYRPLANKLSKNAQ